MTLKVTFDYPGQTRDILVDLMPQLKAWFSKARENSERVFKESKLGLYVETQALGTRVSIEGEPVMMFLTFIIDRGELKATAHSYIGSENNVRTAAANQEESMKRLALESKNSSFLQVEGEGRQDEGN